MRAGGIEGGVHGAASDGVRREMRASRPYWHEAPANKP